MLRRGLLAATVAAATRGLSQERRYRACLIGHTGHGNYGHDWDTSFRGFGNIDVLGVADPDEAGRAKAQSRSGARRAYADFRRMLDQERADLVGIFTRWADQRVPMVRAAAEHGAHIIMEKPFAATLEEADAMARIARERGIRIQVGHTTRTSAVVRRMVEMVKSGEIGDVLEMRTRGKEDRRAGGEDMMVLGSHLFDLIRMFAGDPRWAFAHVSRDGADIGPPDFRRGSEPVGPVAGNQIAAMFGFDGGVHGYFSSKASAQTNGPRFGFTVFGTKGLLYLPLSFEQFGGRPSILRSESWRSGGGAGEWQPLDPQMETRAEANASMVRDLLQAIEHDREPSCSARDGLWTVEMATAVYQSQLTRRPVELPLRDRRSPALEP